MRPFDIYRSGKDMEMMRITPEAGTQKSGSCRDIAVHSHLLSQGFLAYVISCGGQPLFYDPARARTEPDPLKLSAKAGEWLAAWIRRNCIKDRRAQPNHAWRHRFKSLSRAMGMREDFVELAMGHAPNGASRSYGNYWPMFVKKQTEMIEPYVVPNIPILDPNEVSAQIARIPNWPRSTNQPSADINAITEWRRSFRILEPRMPTDPSSRAPRSEI